MTWRGPGGELPVGAEGGEVGHRHSVSDPSARCRQHVVQSMWQGSLSAVTGYHGVVTVIRIPRLHTAGWVVEAQGGPGGSIGCRLVKDSGDSEAWRTHAGVVDRLMAMIKTPLQTRQTHLAGMGLARVMEIRPVPVPLPTLIRNPHEF